jgi:ATP-dependent Clp protease ATP-binding subunit ClpX
MDNLLNRLNRMEPPQIRTAHEIKEHLDRFVVGQDEAKVQLSVLFSMHLSWFSHENKMHRSPNAIIIGPTGVGKTHSIRIASDFLGLPFAVVDTTSLVPSGIAGLQIEDILEDLVRTASGMLGETIDDHTVRFSDRSIQLARRGIIFLDEFDKIATPDTSRDHDGNKWSVQRRLLKLIEGAVLGIGTRRHVDVRVPQTIDTSGILIVVGGAFDKIASQEVRNKRSQAIQREVRTDAIVSEDVMNYGFIPELVARLPIIIRYEPLNFNDLKRILEIAEVSPIQVWINHFNNIHKTLLVTDDAKEYAAEKAAKMSLGARGLQQVLFPCLAKLAYNMESSEDGECIVDRNILLETVASMYERRAYANPNDV